MYSIDYSLLPSDIATILKNSNSVVYMSEFFNDCVAKIRVLLGPSDITVMQCIKSNPVIMTSILLFEAIEGVKSKTLSEFLDVLDLYFDYPLGQLKSLRIDCHLTENCFADFIQRCPNCELTIYVSLLPQELPKTIPRIRGLHIPHTVEGSPVHQWVATNFVDLVTLNISGCHFKEEGKI
jgi:hypothetical protein